MGAGVKTHLPARPPAEPRPAPPQHVPQLPKEATGPSTPASWRVAHYLLGRWLSVWADRGCSMAPDDDQWHRSPQVDQHPHQRNPWSPRFPARPRARRSLQLVLQLTSPRPRESASGGSSLLPDTVSYVDTWGWAVSLPGALDRCGRSSGSADGRTGHTAPAVVENVSTRQDQAMNKPSISAGLSRALDWAGLPLPLGLLAIGIRDYRDGASVGRPMGGAVLVLVSLWVVRRGLPHRRARTTVSP